MKPLSDYHKKMIEGLKNFASEIDKMPPEKLDKILERAKDKAPQYAVLENALMEDYMSNKVFLATSKNTSRKPNQCPKCKQDGDPALSSLGEDKNGNKLVFQGTYASNYSCTECDLEWDPNEDFYCLICGGEVPGRYLTCIKDDCIAKWELFEQTGETKGTQLC